MQTIITFIVTVNSYVLSATD